MIRPARTATTDLRDNQPLILTTGIVGLSLLALLLRLELTSFSDADYTQYLSPWYDHLKQNGIRGFGDNFSNYNFPYLFLLYLSTFLPIAKIVSFKLIAIAFDFVLATAVYLLVRDVSKDITKSVIAGLATLFMPTVFINSSMWGQSDVIYVAFTLLSLHYVFVGKLLLTWMLFGIAFAFKVQAIFFLPVLVYTWLKKAGPWYAPLIAIPTFLVLSIPPVLFGRPIGETLMIYAYQAEQIPALSVSAPNLYMWIPADQYWLLKTPALILTVATIGLFLLFCVLRIEYNQKNLVSMSALFFVLAPFLLPHMHERYFYGFEIVCVVLAALDHRSIWLVVLSQSLAFFTYSTFLFNTMIVPWPFLSLAMLVLLASLIQRIAACSRDAGRDA